MAVLAVQAETAYFLPTNAYVDVNYTATRTANGVQTWLDDYVPTNADDVVYIGLPDAPLFGSGRFWPMGDKVFTIDSIAWAPYNFNFYFLSNNSGVTLRDAVNCFSTWNPSVGGVTFTKKTGSSDQLVFQRIFGSYRTVFNSPATEDVICVSNLFRSGVIEKRGAGELHLAKPAGSRLVANLYGGTIELGHEVTDDQPATNRYFHLDASVPSTLLTYERVDGRLCVTNWLDADGKTLKATPVEDDLSTCPFISDEKAANGVNLVSFGGYSKDADDVAAHGPAARMWLNYQSGVREIFQVVKVNGANGHGFYLSQFYADGFRLKASANQMHESADGFNMGPVNQRLNGVPYLDSYRDINRLAVLSSYEDVNKDGSGGWYLCSNYKDQSVYGGYSAAEVLAYNRVLTENERQATIRYLTKKWLKPEESKVCDAGVISVRAATSETHVAEGGRADVSAVRVHNPDHEFVKTGAGDLYLEETYPATAKVRVKGGRVVFTDTKTSPDNPQPAAGAYVHVDATKGASFIDELDSQGCPTGRIVGWRDWREGNTLFYTNVSTVVENAGVTPNAMNGHAAVDFGSVISKTTPAFILKDSSGVSVPKFMTAFVVWENISGSKDTVPYPFGGNGWSFIRSTTRDLAGCWYDVGAHANIQGAFWTVDGEPYNRDGDAYGQAFGAPMVLGISFPTADPVSYLGKCQDGDYDGGGLRIGEVLLYTRSLTDEERRDTEAYLLRKWKNAPHPAYRAKVGALAFDGDAEPEIAVENGVREFGSVSGANAFVKTGAGKAKVDEVGAVDALSVEGGELDVTFRNDFAEEVLSAAFCHFDAEAADSIETETVGDRVEIVRMNHATRANGPYALGTARFQMSITNRPTLAETTIAGRTRKVVDFGEFFTSGKTDGVYPVDNDAAAFKLSQDLWSVKEFYVVVRDIDPQKRKPIFDSWEYFIDRGADGKMFSPHGAHDCFGSYTLTVDGTSADYSAALPDGWHVVCFVPGPSSAPIQGFGSAERAGKILIGGQQVAELITFGETHDEATRARITDYLRRKWLGEGDGETLRIKSLAAADGTTLTVGENGYQSFEAEKVFGGGTITVANGLPVVLGGIDVTATAPDALTCVTIDGEVRLFGKLSVNLTAAPGVRALVNGSYPVLRASAISGSAAFVLDGQRQLCRAYALRVVGDVLRLEVIPANTVIIFR